MRRRSPGRTPPTRCWPATGARSATSPPQRRGVGVQRDRASVAQAAPLDVAPRGGRMTFARAARDRGRAAGQRADLFATRRRTRRAAGPGRGAARRAQAQDQHHPEHRRAFGARRGVRVPQARREPRGRLPVPAQAQPPALRRRLHAGQRRRHLPGRPDVAGVGRRRRDRPGARAGARSGGLRLQYVAGVGFSLVDPERVGVAGVPRRVAEEPGGVRAPDRRR